MKNILGITQHNITKLDSYSNKVSQRLKRKILTLAKQLGIRNLKDLRRHPLFRSHFTKATKFIESGRHDKACNSYEQIIFSILKILQRKKIDTHYKDTLNIRSQNEMRQAIMMKDGEIGDLQKELDRKDQDIMMKDEEIGNLQQKLDQNVSQMNELKQLVCKYYMLELENAKYEFGRRKNEMIKQLGYARRDMNGWEKNGCNVFETLIQACEQEKLPKAGEDHKDGAELLSKYHHELNEGFWAQTMAGGNKLYYMNILDFLQNERLKHISSIQRLEKSVKDLSIYLPELNELLV